MVRPMSCILVALAILALAVVSGCAKKPVAPEDPLRSAPEDVAAESTDPADDSGSTEDPAADDATGDEAAKKKAPKIKKPEPPPPPPEISWLDDFDAAKKKAAKSDKLIMLQLFDPKLPPSVTMDERTMGDVITRQAALKFVCVKLDIWENREFVEGLGVKTMPAVLFFDATGKELTRVEMLLDPPQFVKVMAKAIEESK